MTYEYDDLLWVELTDPKNFLVIVETLTRIGLLNRDKTRLTQTCHILHKRGKFAILHFKELFLLEGKDSEFTMDDETRRNSIVRLLEKWNLITIPEETRKKIDQCGYAKNEDWTIIPHKDKAKYQLISKYQVGGKKRRTDNDNDEQ